MRCNISMCTCITHEKWKTLPLLQLKKHFSKCKFNQRAIEEDSQSWSHRELRRYLMIYCESLRTLHYYFRNIPKEFPLEIIQQEFRKTDYKEKRIEEQYKSYFFIDASLFRRCSKKRNCRICGLQFHFGTHSCFLVLLLLSSTCISQSNL